ncbi:lipopolysaccharide biosynthesis protein [Sphingobacterium spiritivorum]|uniref:lipopolysaccharide biosynthesis protein n=1 Tax=Sphingobacterium spiritivorum TaxID=258 RepID=UPI00191A74D3|nr:hypothetical protein [Sphingobacterium spiritivorum]QQT27807.1 hypothetical protein I6J02_08180 [Sphingobacterium spiritivorum]
MEKVLKYLGNESFVYIIVNILVAFLGFARSFAFIKFFGFGDLGVITMVNTASMLITFFQIGTINGGYRIIALGEIESNVKTNNVIYSYLGTISLIVSFLGLVFWWCEISSFQLIIISVLLGVLLLFNNWLTNCLIASKKLKKLNLTNLISSILGFFSLVLIPSLGLTGALIALLVQPVIFIVLNLNKNTFPTKFDLDIKYLRYILGFGFIPYVSGIFYLSYMQIERWSINSLLGKEALGSLYLFFLILNLWTLIPSSILNIFFPKAIKAYSNGEMEEFRNVLRSDLIAVLGYLVFSIVMILLFLKIMVGALFPQHLPYVSLVYLAIPGLVMKALTDPLALFFNSIVNLKPIFWSDFVSIVVYILSIVFFKVFVDINLNSFIYCFNLYFLCKLLYLFAVYTKVKNNYDV